MKEHLKSKYGRSADKSISDSIVQITETCMEDTSTKGTKGMDSTKTTISSGSKSHRVPKNVLQQLDKQRSNMSTPQSSWYPP